VTADLAILRRAVRIEMQRRGLGTLLRWSPQLPTDRQLEFLEVDDFEAGYGGAAGGGKSSCALMDALRYVDVPGYSCGLFRLTFTDLSLPGALMDRAHQWLAPSGAHWNDQKKRWTFPRPDGPPAMLSFGYCETPKDVYRYQGSEFQRIGIDELTQWQEAPYLYLTGRIRRLANATVPIGVRAYTNPGGVGHLWVKKRLVDPATRVGRFVAAKLADNPHLDQESYRKTLERLDTTTRDQLLHGLWVQDDEGRVYRFERARNLVPALPEHMASDAWRAILAVDLGASERKPTTGFVVVLWHPHDPIVYIARAWVEAGITPSTLAEKIKATKTWIENDLGATLDCVVMDEGALGRGYGGEMRQRYGIAARAAEKRDKLGFRKLLNGEFRDGKVLLLEGACDALIEELENLVWNEAGTDNAPGLANHASDALLYGWRQARAYTSRAPDQQPAPGTRAALDLEAKRIREAEKKRFRERSSRAPGEGW
jgi:hypothetical protein